MQNTFLFHDYETFGINPALDRPAQFAAIRSDVNFNIIDEPRTFYCKPPNDYLPQPSAVMVTGITPQQAHKQGVNEAEFAKKIYDLFTVPNTCVVGYNNICFDDEVTRNIFYRNFYDPYAWSWKNGNSRWDLLDIMRACYALRPEGIIWPKNDNGFPSFRLEHLASANGIKHHNSHDAISDVYATIGVARLVKAAQPRLFNYLLYYRQKQKLTTLISLQKIKPLIHVSRIFGVHRNNISWVAPLAWHPNNQNVLIVVDLACNIIPLLEMDSNALYEWIHTQEEVLKNGSWLPIKLVHINKCPVLVPLNTLRLKDINRLEININYCLNNLKILRKNPSIRSKVIEIFSKPQVFIISDNVDTQLYNGFFSKADRVAMDIILKTKPQDLSELDISFIDARIKKLMFNYRARNYPSTLNKIEQLRWFQYCQTIFTPKFLQAYTNELKRLFVKHQGDSEKQKQLKALWKYIHETI